MLPGMKLTKGTRVVITGAGSGLGRAFAEELSERGAKLLLGDINETGLQETANRVRTLGAVDVVTQTTDVRNADEVERLAALADDKWGGSDLVVNNAGVAVSGAVGDVPLEDWKWVVDINLWGVIYGCHAFVPRFRKQRSGHVLNVASAAGLVSTPNLAPYNVTKAGVVALTESLRAELSGSGVGVTVLCPTFFKTNIVKTGRSSGHPKTTAMAEKLMDRAKIDARGVARTALRGVERDELYVLPMADARWMWRIKRAAPSAMGLVMGAFGRRF